MLAVSQERLALNHQPLLHWAFCNFCRRDLPCVSPIFVIGSSAVTGYFLLLSIDRSHRHTFLDTQSILKLSPPY